MTLVILIFITAPENAYITETNEGDNVSLHAELNFLRWYMFFTHFFAAFTMFASQFVTENYFTAMTVLTIIAMMLQVVNITSVSNFLFVNTESILHTAQGGAMAAEYSEFVTWLCIELCVFIAGIFGHTAFLMVRSILPQKMILSAPNLLAGSRTDYLESQQVLCGILITFVVPAFVLRYVSGQMIDDGSSFDEA